MMNKLRRRMKSEEGFTLIEMMVVVAVIGILAAILFPKINGVRGKAEDAHITAAGGSIRTAMELYYAEHGAYPTDGTYSALRATLTNYNVPDLTKYATSVVNTNTTSHYSITFTSTNTSETFTLSDGGVSW